MEMEILLNIQRWRTPVLDKIMATLFHTVIDEKGVFVVLLGLCLLAIKKTRRYGGLMLLSVLLSYIVGGLLLKNIFCRPRPFTVNPTVTLLPQTPHGYSFPSLHTALAFSCATTVFLKNKKAGIPCLLLAAVIGFSRLYFFVHYPSDVLCGAFLGVLCAVAVAKAACVFSGRRLARHNKQS